MSKYAIDMRCPKCQHVGKFHVHCGALVTIEPGPDGRDIETDFRDADLSYEYTAICGGCEYEATMQDFCFLTKDQVKEARRFLQTRILGNDEFVRDLIEIAINRMTPDELHDLKLTAEKEVKI